ncbi:MULTISPECIES: EAL domain-containing protein [unclassified Rhizobium]|uniref:EAL domain-containing protein n=1 Tax=unclassified Rhizobium TaxID=2613769 RepID=UPI001AE37E5F|nr:MULTISPECIES: EAL domain-containing protein [unclassified Rhizobium]MBP2461657.1 EAL domain-containing protein (putative c-di-GMP-specific phosphodiesterase class I) [Rhizobium sp. PvP014]MBP2529052.1 EAL domain-containing protein (putative c-di-GMP-specific phosphodiesterase class I) [Rhizobium sp. PvP099]
MASRSIFANLVRGDDGAWSTAYGPFILRSALQPIFRTSKPGNRLTIEAFVGLVRAYRGEEPVPPHEFFSLVDPAEVADIDSMVRTIHILNTGRLDRRQAKIFVKFQPGLVRTPEDMRHEVERIKLASHEAGLAVNRIVCEIRQTAETNAAVIADFTSHMRAIGFQVAIDDYGAGESDLALLKRVKPDYVKFEPGWVRDFLDNPAGAALLRVVLQQMLDDGIEPIIEGLEEMWQVEVCEEFGASLVQGYALARPELAPTTFDRTFPEHGPPRIGGDLDMSPSPASAIRVSAAAPFPSATPLKRMKTFGRRHQGS